MMVSMLTGVLLLIAACSAASAAAAAAAAAAPAGQRLFVLGGSDPRKKPLGMVAAFTLDADKTNGTWETVAAMGSVRASGRAASLGDSVYHVGGSDLADYPYLNSSLRYSPADPEGGGWKSVADLPCDPAHPVFCPDVLGDDPSGGGIADHALVTLGDYLYAVGGTNGTTSLSSVERYSPAKDKWEFVAPMSIGRW
jgi:N-acetylneuraminic acid mutarotase